MQSKSVGYRHERLDPTVPSAVRGRALMKRGRGNPGARSQGLPRQWGAPLPIFFRGSSCQAEVWCRPPRADDQAAVPPGVLGALCQGGRLRNTTLLSRKRLERVSSALSKILEWKNGELSVACPGPTSLAQSLVCGSTRVPGDHFLLRTNQSIHHDGQHGFRSSFRVSLSAFSMVGPGSSSGPLRASTATATAGPTAVNVQC
eukprot:s482_g5.t1